MKQLNPAEFFGEEGWKFDPKEERAITTTINPLCVNMVSMLRPGEMSMRSITGEKHLARLKASNHIRLGADTFLFFWENKQFIPKDWKRYNPVFFDGDVLLSPRGYRCSFGLFWDGGKWNWRCCPFVADRSPRGPSAVLAR